MLAGLYTYQCSRNVTGEEGVVTQAVVVEEKEANDIYT